MRQRMLLVVAGAAAILGAALLVGGCGGGDVVVGSGDLVTEDYDLEGFSRLDVSHAFEVEVRRGDAYEVKVTVDDNLLDRLDVSLKGDTLRIGLEGVTPYEHTTQRAVGMDWEILRDADDSMSKAGSSTQSTGGSIHGRRPGAAHARCDRLPRDHVPVLTLAPEPIRGGSWHRERKIYAS